MSSIIFVEFYLPQPPPRSSPLICVNSREFAANHLFRDFPEISPLIPYTCKNQPSFPHTSAATVKVGMRTALANIPVRPESPPTSYGRGRAQTPSQDNWLRFVSQSSQGAILVRTRPRKCTILHKAHRPHLPTLSRIGFVSKKSVSIRVQPWPIQTPPPPSPEKTISPTHPPCTNLHKTPTRTRRVIQNWLRFDKHPHTLIRASKRHPNDILKTAARPLF